MAIKSNSVFWGGFWHILKKLLEISASELSTVQVSHYPKTVLAVVLFAKVRGLVMFESPRTRRVRGLSDFTSPRTFVKSISAKTILR